MARSRYIAILTKLYKGSETSFWSPTLIEKHVRNMTLVFKNLEAKSPNLGILGQNVAQISRFEHF